MQSRDQREIQSTTSPDSPERVAQRVSARVVIAAGVLAFYVRVRHALQQHDGPGGLKDPEFSGGSAGRRKVPSAGVGEEPLRLLG